MNAKTDILIRHLLTEDAKQMRDLLRVFGEAFEEVVNEEGDDSNNNPM